ncbi:MAG: hypothetical protein AAF152_02460 [Cyanobacteria bacterium P01_A01_bin.114]
MLLNTSLIGQTAQGYDLAHGQAWEAALAAALTAQGLRAYQPKQIFAAPRTPADELAFWAKYPDKAYLRPYQLDLVVRSGLGRFNLEVKALTGAAFRYDPVHIGCVEKWDAKRWLCDQALKLSQGSMPAVPVHAIALINRDSGEARLCHADKRLWVQRPALCSQGTDYAVEQRYLTPLSDWVENIRAET